MLWNGGERRTKKGSFFLKPPELVLSFGTSPLIKFKACKRKIHCFDDKEKLEQNLYPVSSVEAEETPSNQFEPPALGAYDSVTSKEEDFNTRIVGCWWAKIMFDAFTYDVAF